MTALADNTLTASFWPATKKTPAHVTIDRIEGGRRHFVTVLQAKDKKEARVVAQMMNAEPWNF